MSAKVIAVCCQKGGVGKTFTTASLGFGLARTGKRVIGVDIDPQGSLARSLGFDPDSLKDTLANYLFQVMEGQEFTSKSGILHHREGMDILPANIKLASTELMMAGQMNRELILKQYVETLRSSYDYILLDCPGSLGLLTINALAAADSVLIPTQAEQLAVEGLQAVLGAIGNVKRGINKDLIVQGILPTMVKERTNHMKAVIAGLHDAYGKQIHIYGTIPASIRAPESSAVGESIYAYDPKGKLAEMYGRLAQEVSGV